MTAQAQRDGDVDPGLVARVREAWIATLPSQPFDPTRSWEETGADSLLTLHLLLRLQNALGRKLSFDLIEPASTVADIAFALQKRDSPASDDSPVVFLVPGVFGDEPILANFRRRLAGRVRFEIVELPEAGESDKVLTSLAATGRFVACGIMRNCPEGTVQLAGYSFGGSVAFEAAQNLVAAGRRVGFLGVLDGLLQQSTPGYVEPGSRDSIWSMTFLRGLAGALARRDTLRLREVLRLRLGTSDTGRRLLIAACQRYRPTGLVELRRALLLQLRRQALDSWNPKPISVPGFVWLSTELAPLTMETWRRLCPLMPVSILPGSHRTLFQDPSVRTLAPAFGDAVHAASGLA